MVKNLRSQVKKLKKEKKQQEKNLKSLPGVAVADRRTHTSNRLPSPSSFSFLSFPSSISCFLSLLTRQKYHAMYSRRLQSPTPVSKVYFIFKWQRLWSSNMGPNKLTFFIYYVAQIMVPRVGPTIKELNNQIQYS